VFLTDALQYFDGSCEICMIDNTHVVVLQGTGRNMVPVPEMASFAERYGFQFQAHEKGDANRSARVERQFHYIQQTGFNLHLILLPNINVKTISRNTFLLLYHLPRRK